MRTKVVLVVLCLTMLSAAALIATAPIELVIDDFIDSPYKKVLANRPTFLTEYQTGPNIVGGVRQTSFTVTRANPNVGQSTLLQIRRNGYLVVSGDYKSHFGLYLGYGYDAAGGGQQLNLNLSGNGAECFGCDRFRINFDGSDSELSHLVQVHDGDGDIATLAGTESTARNTQFHLDFPFADFVQNSDNPVDWDRIDFIFVLFQTGNVLGAHDFVVTRISAIPEPTP